MNSLSFVFLFHVLPGIHGKGLVANTVNLHCKGYSGIDGLFSCLYRNYHNEKDCMEIIKKTIHSAMDKNLTKECLVEQSKLPCTKCNRNNSCTKIDCRELLSLFIEGLQNRHKRMANNIDLQNCDDATSGHTSDENESRNEEEHEGVIGTEEPEKNREEHDKSTRRYSRNSNDTTDSYTNDKKKGMIEKEKGKGNDIKKDRENNKKQIFKLGAIVGMSVGITGTIILFVIILVIIFVCRRRSKKKKRKEMTRLQSIDQRLEMAHLKRSPSSTNKGGYNNLSTNKSLSTDAAQGEYFVLDPSITKYDKDLSNRKLPEIKRFSGAEGDKNVYYEIDEDKIELSTDMKGVHQKQIEVRNQGSNHSHQTKNQTQLRSKKNNTEQLTRPQFVDKRAEMSHLKSSPSSTNKEGNNILSANKLLNTDEAQCEYFVLDPSVTKYDKDLVLPEVKRISVAHGDEKVYNEIDEDKIESSTDMKVDHEKRIEEVRDIAIYHADLTNNQNQLGFGNTNYNVTSEVDDQIY